MAENSNDIPIEAWNTILFDKFVRFRRVLTAGLEEHGEAALARAAYRAGARVLDVGCGFGDTTLAIAGMVGPGGAAVGVDCAENFIAVATKEAAEAGAANAAYFVADVQTENLHGPYDHAFARFGTMFFNMPGAALRNIARALKPGGDFTMVVWRKREDNPWVHDAEQIVREMVPVVAHEDTTEVHCGPGPFSMAGADMVSDMMAAAGFRRIGFERHDCDICIGADMDEAVAFAMALGPAGEIIRLAGAEGERLAPKVSEALRMLFAKRRRSDGSIWAGSSSWIVRGEIPR
ncbi:MAG TPA: class I SAM-dependent methyltransferase [Vitreimonas sp.]|uniref:class I SAM-dependent methyltransferase n=1 Tax=Vitreimonas sp. TaxID=3069702 RepID=UPI002D28342A|nr:class I SAM-dependent methyltransferase [Vitreimonas sp.]HYD89122.1 class I SAM-dependent methyltransferase [Vitreimonas sp.]